MSDNKIKSSIIIFLFVLSLSISLILPVTAQTSNGDMNFKELAQIATGGDTFQTEIVGDVAFVMDMNAGLKTYDVSNPSSPELLDSYYDGGQPHHFMIDGDSLYLADHADGLEIYDISDPSNLEKLGELSDSGDGETDGVFVSDNIAYTAEWHDSTWSWKMVLINVTNPQSPERISEYIDADNEFIRFYVQGDICYVSCLDSGFKVLNVSDPYSITEINTYDEGSAFYFIIEEDIAFLSSTDFKILNITDITNLTSICNYTTENTVFPILKEDDLVFLGVYEIGLKVLNISSVQNPGEIGHYDTDRLVNIAKSGEYLYLSSHGKGLVILKIEIGKTIGSFSTFFLIISILTVTTVLVTKIQKKKS